MALNPWTRRIEEERRAQRDTGRVVEIREGDLGAKWSALMIRDIFYGAAARYVQDQNTLPAIRAELDSLPPSLSDTDKFMDAAHDLELRREGARIAAGSVVDFAASLQLETAGLREAAETGKRNSRSTSLYGSVQAAVRVADAFAEVFAGKYGVEATAALLPAAVVQTRYFEGERALDRLLMFVHER